ncbi:exopolysaccharide biosynthesis protein [Agrobacterium genomosp. 3]|uniref:exopolysaccharide biosynthesis protein n=1 Tax=Agrobacterium TaxID=357 RepID=UPI001CD8D00D|nr:exopolysaccharide biosynthesis protein [Agrobacterium sp.]MCA1869649.1 exopolysaccharide biosynthesis protein [Agrobacterium tomkonis]MCA1879984.1 exopolysaccharide biosynthesis protein [Agrobacterium tumefaciens]MCA1895225.1 exopolysaccharide biosynthesis protein [Agrobacterium tomkonis]MCD4661957.1 exopolysaccharide biosynthesis protein [Agrobacterium sp.]
MRDVASTDGIASLLRNLPDRLPRAVTVGDLLRAMGDQGIAVVLLMFAIPAIIPTPGIPAGLVFGIALALLSMQIIFGAERLRLPGRLAAVGVPRAVIERTATHGAPILARLERHMRPRGRLLSQAAMRPVLGLVILTMAILIALPIPFGNMLPGLAVLITALGMAQRDSLAIGIGLLLAMLATGVSAGILAGGWWLITDWVDLDTTSSHPKS